MKQANLKRITERIGDFPTLPTIVAHVMQVLENPYSSASDLTEIVSRDQAMMFRILKMANSAYYGFPRAISTVTESIVLLGFATVRNLILTTTMYHFDQMWARPEAAPPSAGPHPVNYWQEWRHAVATAIAARELQEQLRQEAGEHTGYLAGLMHDIGKVLFHYYLRNEYQKVLTRLDQEPDNLSGIEKRIMGASHGQVGSWIVDRWNLPKEIVAPIAWHHEPGQAKENRELAWILAIADWMAHGALEERQDQPCPEGFMEVTDELAGKIRQKIQMELKHIESFMVV